MRSDYEGLLGQETGFLPTMPTQNAPVHFGISLRTDLLNTIVAHATTSSLDSALNLTESIKVASGQSISVKTEGKVMDLAVYADKSCENCIRLAGKLDGTLAVKLPALPIQRVPLRGSLALVAPIVFERAENGETQVKLDSSKALEIGKSSVDTEIAQLPPTWANVLRGPLSSLLLKAVAKQVGNITVASFPAPDLGIKGLKTAPALLKTDTKNAVIYLGFTTNLPIESSLVADTTLPKNKNIGITAHPALLNPLIQAALKTNAIPRRYTDEGKANANGNMHVTVRDFKLDPSTNAFDMQMRFWNLKDSGQCYWMDTSASGSLQIADNAIKASVKDMAITESSMPGIAVAIANWKTSDIVESGRMAMQKSFSNEVIQIPGSTAKVERASMGASGGGIQFQGFLGVKKAEQLGTVDEEDAAE
jgi:hypothetical protein